MTSTATATTTTVPEVWIYPPGSAILAPQGQTSDFGPIHNGDSMVLQWNPASMQPAIGYACTTLSGIISSVKVIDENTSTSPYTFHINVIPLTNGSTADIPYCHVWFPNSQIGNSVQWQYAIDARANPSTFAAAAVLASSTSTSSTATLSSTSTAIRPITTMTTTQSSSSFGVSSQTTVSTASVGPASATADAAVTSPSSSGPSAAGIGAGVGVGIVVIALFLAGLFFWLRRRRHHAAARVSELNSAPTVHEVDDQSRFEIGESKAGRKVVAKELSGNDAAHEME